MLTKMAIGNSENPTSAGEVEYTHEFVQDQLDDDLIALTAYRGYLILDENDGVLDEKKEIPFVTSPFYPFLLLGYLILSRIRFHIRGILKQPIPVLDGHVFVVSSRAAYRFYPLVYVANSMSNNVTLLCTKAARQKLREEFPKLVDDTVAHRSLHQRIPLTFVVKAAIRAWVINRRMAKRLQVKNIRFRWIVYNLVLTEFVKSKSFFLSKHLLRSLHTQSPSPYILDNVDDDQLYLYQHGQTISMTKRLAAIGCKLTYFTWGPGWNPEKYCSEKALRTINFVPVGNPLFDEMVDRRGERANEPTYDVLFLSQAHALTQLDPGTYENLVGSVVEICERRGHTLGIKLHPTQGESAFYKDRGWVEYLLEGDMQEAVLDSRITVTDCSSGFIESVILGTPVIMTQQILQIGDQELLTKTPGIVLVEKLESLDTAMEEAMYETDISIENLNEYVVFMLGGSVGRIIDQVNGNAVTSTSETDKSSA